VKVYLDASPDERARRRALDSAHAAGQLGKDVASVAQALAARDQTDRTRAMSPLTLAPDAVYLDTTALTIDDVVRTVMALVHARLASARAAEPAITPAER
jgi:cytidylate kinase